MTSNFEFLAAHWPDLALSARVAELSLHTDPTGAAELLGDFGVRLAWHIALGEKLKFPRDMEYAELIRRLRFGGMLPKRIDDMLYSLKRGAALARRGEITAPEQLHVTLRLARNLGLWFALVYGDPALTAEPFALLEPPEDPDLCQSQAAEQKAALAQLPDPVRAETPGCALPRSQRQKCAEETASSLPLSEEEQHHLAREKVRLEPSAMGVVNYALQHNRVPIIRSLTVIHNDEQPLEHLELNITSTPELCMPYHKHIDLIPGKAVYNIRDIKLLLNTAYLAGLTEKTTGVLHFTLSKGDAVLCREDMEITALAFDQWHGSSVYPELLAAFITPNHPAIAQINAKTTRFLESWTGDPSLDAYQTGDPNRVLAQAGAVYAALQSENIVYAVHPASFEGVGQRVRLCDTVLSQKMGNCLDLTLFYAACLEAIGLHPILLLQRGHIFAGVWLEDRAFPESVQDDVSLITKRLASGINEIAVCECTCFTAGQATSFNDARAAAEAKLTGTDSIESIIDVNRARLSGILPLPQRVLDGDTWQVIRPDVDPRKLTGAPDAIGQTIDVTIPDSAAPLSRQTQWERKLLDLGLRNQLINMRMTRTMLPLLTTSVEELEDALTGGADFSILPRPGDWMLPAGQVDFESMHDLTGLEEVINSEFKNHRLRSACTEAELSRTIKELYRASRTALEENGANTLYLALGVLRWYETPRSTKPRYAPVVLLPVDIVRKSAAQGYVIRLRDDEAQMNITVLEKMKQDFQLTVAGLDPLPTDEQGIDIRRVFTILRKAVMGQPRWDVLESAYLGIFSFSQFVMWNDIRNRSEDLKRNKIVRSLMDGRLAWDAAEMEIGSRVPEENVFLPLSADASQLFAIEAASAGESFVLHGPPGTGKSQTITAMIANALAQNKTVLFVAEKMAALEVVQKRLEAIGIGPFCLELHSNKSKKRTVLEQLRRATEVTRHTAPEAYAQKAQQIAMLRRELDSYAQALHTPLKCGLTVFTLISRYEQLQDAQELELFQPGALMELTAADLDERDTLLERLVAAAKAVGHPKDHPLAQVGCTSYSQSLRRELSGVLADYRKALADYARALTTLTDAMGQPTPQCHSDLQEMAQLARILLDYLKYPRAWCAAENPHVYLEDVCAMARCHKKAAEYRRQLLVNWTEGFLHQDPAALTAELNAIEGKWLLARTMELNKLIRRLSAWAKTPVNKDTLRQQFALLDAYRAQENQAKDHRSRLGAGLESLYAGENTDWNGIISAAGQLRTVNEALYRMGAPEEFRMYYAGDRSYETPLRELLRAWEALNRPKQALEKLLNLDNPAGERWLDSQNALCDHLEANAHHLREWVTWNHIATQARALGLGRLVDAYAAGLAHEDVPDVYHRALYRTLADLEISRSPALNTFSGAVFNEKIAQLRRLDEQLTDLTRQEIFCRLASKVPNFAKEAAHSSEVGILQRAIRSGGRGVSLRKLFEQIPTLLPRLCPCMLMSPISAAQYLDPERELFHIVVFDEASQLTTSKAVGALARGRDAIIVGDPKQMPPTSFFATNAVDEENLDVEDLESILDDCLAMNMPQTHLLWHYRSRHESLIAFSNSRFYENKLYTFPSVNDRARKVSLIPIDGVFERGKNRVNRAEAEAIVSELSRRCHDPEQSRFSVGVVTFNISQQNLIDDLLTDACKADPALEKWAFESDEPVFIKNLENVQGDERDVILFSIGYGPDEKGKVYMNFGPLNRDGGWRRLNVAVSRSRHEMMVFSTLTPDQINLSKTGAEGVAALKAFLEYASGSDLPQDEHTASAAQHRCAGIAEAIAAHLKEKGYDADLRVGHSEYRIDVGVIDPEEPERYLLGILLDGEGYGSARTTRDRELAQIGVLNGLGWQILRVWSMDWWDDRDKELARIDQAITELLNSRQAERILAQEAAEAAQAEEAAAQGAEDAGLAVPESLPAAPDAAPLEARLTKKQTQPGTLVYKSAVLRPLTILPEDLLTPRYNISLQSRVKKVLAAEAPITEGLLIRRVIQSFGITRAGSRLQSRMDEVFRTLSLRSTIQDGQRVFWDEGQEPGGYFLFRASGKDENKREAKDVPLQEAANAVVFVLYEQGGISLEDLIRESARLMGYTRTGSVVTPLFESAVRSCAASGKCQSDSSGRWSLTESGISHASKLYVPQS